MPKPEGNGLASFGQSQMPQRIENKQVASSVTQPATSVQPPVASGAPLLTSASSDTAKETIKFVQDKREIIFDPARAAIVEVVFKDNLEHRLPLKIGFLSD